ncbi:hypothetical protein EON81_26010 [bacterium]|nr:MAG: hypothetical protein EON81_26010 [bacterium]
MKRVVGEKPFERIDPVPEGADPRLAAMGKRLEAFVRECRELGFVCTVSVGIPCDCGDPKCKAVDQSVVAMAGNSGHATTLIRKQVVALVKVADRVVGLGR